MLVDDHRMFVDGLVHLLDAEPDIEVVGTAATVEGATRAAAELQPDIVVLDYLLPDGVGTDVMDAVRDTVPRVKFVVVTALDDDATNEAATNAGCHAFVPKDRAADELVGSLRTVASGEPTMRTGATAAAAHAGSALSRRELEVLGLLAEGLSNAEIAERLYISKNTVRIHVQNVLAKLECRSRLEAVAIGVARGLVTGGRRGR